ncbi:hypothetical protein PZC41_14255 [Staphylococcus aureus]|uniref:hypothetical protein n=1 Tax=Staphylococcus aureus TaxID=1280 RepID=UPI0023AFE899|nr:hypothetical protein [Staphylococcus aureus]MDE8535467.1 hypothetical protein [Staphylococcus aureus]
MAATTPNTIVLSDQPYVQGEAKANGTAHTPGELVETLSTDVTKIQRHSTAGGNAQPMFVLENPYSDPADGPRIDAAYGTIDTVRYIAARSGDQIYGWLTVGASVNIGVFLESAGSLGALRATTAGTVNLSRTRFKALQAVNNSAGGARARIKVEVI